MSETTLQLFPTGDPKSVAKAPIVIEETAVARVLRLIQARTNRETRVKSVASATIDHQLERNNAKFRRELWG